jgi:hypothetical protein
MSEPTHYTVATVNGRERRYYAPTDELLGYDPDTEVPVTGLVVFDPVIHPGVDGYLTGAAPGQAVCPDAAPGNAHHCTRGLAHDGDHAAHLFVGAMIARWPR